MTTPVPTQADWDAAAKFSSNWTGSDLGRYALAALIAQTRLTAERETREACARIAEGLFAGHGRQFGTQRSNNYEIAAKRIAAAIRNTENTDGQ